MKKLKWIMLIADDSIVNRVNTIMINKTLSSCDIKVCFNGEEAFNYIKGLQSQKDQLPDLIMLDLNMPIMDGWGFLDSYPSLMANDSLIPIVILSSSPNPDDISKAKSYPYVLDYHIKPLSQEMLENIQKTYFI
jgi:CheY-like chemotaxis protein